MDGLQAILGGLLPVLQRKTVLKSFKFKLDKPVDYASFHRFTMDSSFFYPKRFADPCSQIVRQSSCGHYVM
jgi:hypothetical protein